MWCDQDLITSHDDLFRLVKTSSIVLVNLEDLLGNVELWVFSANLRSEMQNLSGFTATTALLCFLTTECVWPACRLDLLPYLRKWSIMSFAAVFLPTIQDLPFPERWQFTPSAASSLILSRCVCVCVCVCVCWGQGHCSRSLKANHTLLHIARHHLKLQSILPI